MEAANSFAVECLDCEKTVSKQTDGPIRIAFEFGMVMDANICFDFRTKGHFASAAHRRGRPPPTSIRSMDQDVIVIDLEEMVFTIKLDLQDVLSQSGDRRDFHSDAANPETCT